WVRRGLRSSGLASYCLRVSPAGAPRPEVIYLSELRREIGEARVAQGFRHGPSLWGRYPEPHPSDDHMEFESWLTFFARYDFKRRYPKEGDRSWECSLVELE